MLKLNFKIYYGLKNVSPFLSKYNVNGYLRNPRSKVHNIFVNPQTFFTTTKSKNVLHKESEVKDAGKEEKILEHGHEKHTKGFYHHVDEHHGDPRGHLHPDGTRKSEYDCDEYHWDDYWSGVPKQNIVIVNGQKMIKGEETKPFEVLFNVSQHNIPFWPRSRLNIWGKHNMVLKMEFLFFWIPTLIIFSIAIPCYTMLYMIDEVVHTTMTVKVIGRQWYWVYEVESPPDDDEDEDE